MSQDFIDSVKQNPVNAELLKVLPEFGLPQCHLSAGCLFQTFWNLQSGLEPSTNIKDYDVLYFDDSDLSWEAEDHAIKRVRDRLSYLGVSLEVKNQARVHLWYEDRFGYSYPKLKSATEGIDRYLISCACIGVEVRSGCLYAPNGITALRHGVLKMNPTNSIPKLFLEKAVSYKARWPWLTIIDPESV